MEKTSHEQYGFCVSKGSYTYRIVKPGFDLRINRDYLEQADYAEARRLELILHDLRKETAND